MSHTPGPWTIEYSDEDNPKFSCVYGIDGADGKRIITTDCGYYGLTIADAHLIAAAPEMLEALKLATNELNAIRARDGAPQHIDWDKGKPFQTNSCSPEWWDKLTKQCLATIAKAEGKG